MPLFVWAAFALAALLVAGTASINMGSGHAMIFQPSAMPAAALLASQPFLPYYAWLAIGFVAVIAVWLGLKILWGRR